MTDWSIETDADAVARERTGAINGRYQICHPDEGLVETADRLGNAFAIADWCAAQTMQDGRPAYSDPFAFEVFDRMARVGQPTTWRRHSKKAPPEGRCFRHGDRFSMDAWWVVTARREPKT